MGINNRGKRGGFKGKKNPAWKGGVAKLSNGYLLEYAPYHPFPCQGHYVLQHRLIMEQYIKRFLLPEEVVHHINEVRDDNRIENLQLLSGLGEHNSKRKGKKYSEKASLVKRGSKNPNWKGGQGRVK